MIETFKHANHLSSSGEQRGVHETKCKLDKAFLIKVINFVFWLPTFPYTLCSVGRETSWRGQLFDAVRAQAGD